MPIYGILKRFLGEYVDFFVLIIMFILYYFDLINWKLLQGSIEILIFFYLYKVYYIIFVRQYDLTKFYTFTWDFDRMFSKEFLKKYNRYIYVLFLLMPWNIYWYVLVSLVVYTKLIKVWFNGNKDIFFKKYFDVDIRMSFDKYIQWYYTYIDDYVRIFVHEPILRMIIVPMLIRSALIHSSFFGIFKARMFTFLFVSILVFSGINVYLHQLPIWVICIFVYIYFLLIWPIIIKMFNIEYIDYFGRKVKYATPQNIFGAYVLAERNSVNLNCLNLFVVYLDVYNIDKYLYNSFTFIFPNWYKNFLMNDNLNNNGFIDYANGDRKFSGLLFWRYEKTYSSFYCIDCYYNVGHIHYILFCLHFLYYKFNVLYLTEEEKEDLIFICVNIYRIYITGAADAYTFLIDKNYSIALNVLFFDNEKFKVTEGKYNLIIMNYMNLYEKTAHVSIPSKFENINEYIDRIKVASLIKKCSYMFLIPLISEYYDFLHKFIWETNEAIKKEGKVIFSENIFADENTYESGINILKNKELSGFTLKFLKITIEEYQMLSNEKQKKVLNYKEVFETLEYFWKRKCKFHEDTFKEN